MSIKTAGKNIIQENDPQIIRPNVYSICEMVILWCGLLLGVEAFCLRIIILDMLNSVKPNPTAVTVFWLVLVPLAMVAYNTASWSFSKIILSNGDVTLRRFGSADRIHAHDVINVKHKLGRNTDDALFVTANGSLWISKAAYGFTQIDRVTDYVKARRPQLKITEKFY